VTDRAAPNAWRLRRYAVLPSTSDLCRSLAAAGEPEGLAILAARQTAARGSRGRQWESPSGNLSLSVLIRPRERAAAAGQWALLAAVALVETLAPHVTGGHALKLKWPNDVLLDGVKLAGILLDSVADGLAGIEWMVIGMGANLAAAPRVPGRPTAALADIGPPPPPNMVAEAVLARIDYWRRIRLLEGFSPVRAAWLSHAQPPGTPLTLKLQDRDFGGTFAGLGDDGSLLLQSGGRVQAFATGEVLLSVPPSR
jgi:BirA family biotin operon repressor/biotin-[acetyl-CoA-carboxylase] ligase